MTKQGSKSYFSEHIEELKEDIYNLELGVTKRLLEKYKPSKSFKIIDGGKTLVDKTKAA